MLKTFRSISLYEIFVWEDQEPQIKNIQMTSIRATVGEPWLWMEFLPELPVEEGRRTVARWYLVI